MIPADSSSLSSCWWVFCRVIDHFGDAGVSWRLVRQLASRHQSRVHFIVDHLPTLARLDPRVRADYPFPQKLYWQGQGHAVIQVWPWALVEGDGAVLGANGAPDYVISAFSCDLPATVMARLAGKSEPPPWVLFDYLSAESWVADCHGLPAPRPDYPGKRYFFFPGFTAGTGGLLREPDLLATRDDWLTQRMSAHDSSGMTHSLSVSSSDTILRFLTLWCYPHAPVDILCRALAEDGGKWHWTLFDGEVWAERMKVARQEHDYQCVPFQTQDGYDRLLWQSDLNLVRGEDSLVRGIWAGKPFLWHIYPQAGGAHGVKLEAFLVAYLAGADERLTAPLSALFRAWNGEGDVLLTWRAMGGLWSVWQHHARRWSTQMAQQPDLVSLLVNFVNSALK